MYSRELFLVDVEVDEGRRGSLLSLERGFVIGQMRLCVCGPKLAWPVSGRLSCGLDYVLHYRRFRGAMRELRLCPDTAMCGGSQRLDTVMEPGVPTWCLPHVR